MNPQDKQKVLALRKLVPVGLSQGLELLARTDGNLDEAAQLFKTEVIAAVTEKTGADPTTVKQHLEACNYDVEQAIWLIDQERYTLTERVLRLRTNKEWALVRIVGEVERVNGITREVWLNFSELKGLEPEPHCLVVIMEWLAYTDYEGLDYGGLYQLDAVLDQLEHQLSLPEVAALLREARTVYLAQEDAQWEKMIKEGIFGPTPEFRRLEKQFDEKKGLILDRLYAMVEQNVTKFP